MDVKSWVSIEPVALRGADNVLKREGVVDAFLLREIQVGVVDVMVDCDEHLTLTSINNSVVLCPERGKLYLSIKHSRIVQKSPS